MAAHSSVMTAVRRHGRRTVGRLLGICNGFQMLLEIGLLPGAMLMNRTLRFICRDVHLRVERNDPPSSSGTSPVVRCFRLPIAPQGGNWFAHPDVMREVEAKGMARFATARLTGELDDGANPNGALDAIAGLVQLCRATCSG